MSSWPWDTPEDEQDRQDDIASNSWSAAMESGDPAAVEDMDTWSPDDVAEYYDAGNPEP
jgi:hypothetical protein